MLRLEEGGTQNIRTMGIRVIHGEGIMYSIDFGAVVGGNAWNMMGQEKERFFHFLSDFI